MKIDAEAMLFSLKCFAAAMLAYYVALKHRAHAARIGR